MSARALDRRAFLAGAAVLAAAGVACTGGLLVPACAGDDPLERALRGFHADAAAARAVGEALLAQERRPPRAGELVARIARGREAELRARALRGADALAAELRVQHRADFAEGRVADLRGWVLSETEAALLALAALG
jgi:hypothetical protein